MSYPWEAGYQNGVRLGRNHHVRHEVIRNTVERYAALVCRLRDSEDEARWSAVLERAYYVGFIEGWWDGFDAPLTVDADNWSWERIN